MRVIQVAQRQHAGRAAFRIRRHQIRRRHVVAGDEHPPDAAQQRVAHRRDRRRAGDDHDGNREHPANFPRASVWSRRSHPG
jgi:hypothetical protein